MAYLLFPTAGTTAEIKVGGDVYQESLITAARDVHQLTEIENASGKRIERIIVVPYDVFQAGELFPLVLNSVHWTTHEEVIRRELLFSEGDAWDPALAEESARNLRSNLFVSVGRVIAVKGTTPETVQVLVVTKDLWSLRINQDWSFVGSRLEFLELEMVEQNLLGRMKTIGPNLRMDLATLSAGQTYRDPRTFGSRIQIEEKAQFILNRTTAKSEGGTFHLIVGQPLYSLKSIQAWDVTLDYRRDINRLFSDGGIYQKKLPVSGESIPFVYHRELGDLKLRWIQSYGFTHKHNLSGGYRTIVRSFALPTETVQAHGAVALEEFRTQEMPYSERAGMVYGNYRFYTPDYHPKVDVNSFAWTEDFRVGPATEIEVRFANPVFGWEARYFEARATADWGFDWDDHLLTTGIGGVLRNQPDAPPATVWVDRLWTAKVTYVLPTWGPVRLHASGRFLRTSFDLDHGEEALGGNGPLRGYPSNFFRGPNLWTTNFELRTKPLNVYSSHIGGAVFFDLGDAFEIPEAIDLHASLGFGLRVVFPQFNREPIRFDFGIPLESINGAVPSYFVAKFGQAF